MTLLNYSNVSDSLVLFSSDEEDSEANYETKQYNNFTAMLKGIPPPSSITISKFTVEEMLQRYKDYKDSFGFFFESKNFTFISNRNKTTPFLKYSNSSHISESIASLIQKVQERYVQLETMSSCNIWFNATLQSCGSAKKRQRMRQRMGLSPGRRLSHLARRRQFFSSANLQRLANTNDIRQIEIKKSDNHRSERWKTSRTIEHEKLNSSKRALFLSPENGTPTKYGNNVSLGGRIFSSGSDEGQKLPLQEKSKKMEVLKWLSQQNFDVDLPRKRLREECANHSVERKRKCPRRSLNFADEEVSKSSNSVVTSDSSVSTKKRPSISLGKLSLNHKNKLLWAVSVVLKENNITRNDQNFKTCASTLFHKCRKNFDEILSLESASGTSEKILHYARSQIPAILEELGIQLEVSNKEKTEKNGEGSSNLEIRNELKENINKNNSENYSCSNSKCLGSELDFIFKTPNKVCRRRPVKSCQKSSSNLERKKKFIKKWHSLESLIDDGVKKFCMKKLDRFVEGISELGTSNIVQKSNEVKKEARTVKGNLNSPMKPYFSSYDVDIVEDKYPSVGEPSVVFSPIASSLKDECGTPKSLFPALCQNFEKSEFISDRNSFSSDANTSAEILNQDKEMEMGIQNLVLKGSFSLASQENEVIGTNSEKCHISVEALKFARNETKLLKKEGSPLDNAYNAKVVTERNDHYVESHNSSTEGSNDSEKVCNVNFNRDNVEKDDPVLQGTDELSDNLGPEEIISEKAVYKPRKLIVKKSKPNWKVVRKNSEEAESESELRLRMRLSHEWEIVCRNSSCSDIGNASECEAASVNYSQISSTNEERDLSSEVDADESNRQSSVHRADESIDQEWEKPNVPVEQNDKLDCVCLDTPNLNSEREKIRRDCSRGGTEYKPPRKKFLKDEEDSSTDEECCSNSFGTDLLNSTLNFEENTFNRREMKIFSDEVVSRKFESPLEYENLYKNEISRREDRGFSFEYSQREQRASPVLLVKNHVLSECAGPKKQKSKFLERSPKKVEGNFPANGESEWNRGLMHTILKVDNLA